MVYFLVGLGGIAGSLLRYGLSFLAVHIWGKDFPIGTLLINLSGAFFLGWITSHFVHAKKLHPNLVTALSTGVIGSYTTFSTFCLETVHLFEENDYLFGFLYIASSLLGGLLFTHLGIQSGRNGVRR
ncbi:fluoride efflux transporter CrcB [Neobacillus sp. NPDC093127]|uniref:fluoride efflux transporter CrcB n=1 Tax=Neobacillus sp. NPDC093127 TaxID=3364296 RepID=UPI0038001060